MSAPALAREQPAKAAEVEDFNHRCPQVGDIARNAGKPSQPGMEEW